MGEFGKTILFRCVAVLAGLIIPYLSAEGIYSLAQGPGATTSLAYNAYARWFVDRKIPPHDPRDPTTEVITHLSQFMRHMDDFKAAGVGLGNSPFHALRTPAVALNAEADGCKVQQPDLRKTITFLKSNLFNPFDQVTAFYDAEQQLSPALQGFFRRYQFRPVRHTTNAYGERLTLPLVAPEVKVLVAGDSVANGVMLDDSETLASQLQAADTARQYVNLGISGADTADILCALEKAARRYAGHIQELIYVFCENDFSPTRPYGTPEALITWLVDFQKRQGIERVIIQYAPYIYNLIPEVTRIHGHSRRDFPTFREEKKRLLRAAEHAGFAIIDYVDVASAEAQDVGSQFAPLALFVDHTHLSRLGVARLLPRYAALRQGRPGDERHGASTPREAP